LVAGRWAILGWVPAAAERFLISWILAPICRLVLRLREAQVVVGCADRFAQAADLIGERMQVGSVEMVG
jgi:hypothetical protein